MTVDFARRALCAATLLLAANVARAGDYVQAAGSSLQFAGSYQGEAFSGRFPGFATSLRFDPKQLAGARLDASGIVTSSRASASCFGSKRSVVAKPGKRPENASPWYVPANCRLEPAACT